jgi:hypothetical protein
VETVRRLASRDRADRYDARAMGDVRVAALLDEVGLPADVDVWIEGHDPVLASKFPVGEAAATAIGAGAAAAEWCHG